MARPTTRVLALLELLQTHRRMTGAELAARLEVDGRTLRRYIAALEDLGIPILAERGRYGGYMLMPGYKVPPLMFTQEETLAVGLGLVAARRLGLGNRAAAIESAQAKLERVMPAPLQKRLRALGETVALDLPAPSAPVDDATLATLAEAIRSARRVRLDYQPEAGAATTRDVDVGSGRKPSAASETDRGSRSADRTHGAVQTPVVDVTTGHEEPDDRLTGLAGAMHKGALHALMLPATERDHEYGFRAPAGAGTHFDGTA